MGTALLGGEGGRLGDADIGDIDGEIEGRKDGLEGGTLIPLMIEGCLLGGEGEILILLMIEGRLLGGGLGNWLGDPLGDLDTLEMGLIEGEIREGAGEMEGLTIGTKDTPDTLEGAEVKSAMTDLPAPLVNAVGNVPFNWVSIACAFAGNLFDDTKVCCALKKSGMSFNRWGFGRNTCPFFLRKNTPCAFLIPCSLNREALIPSILIGLWVVLNPKTFSAATNSELNGSLNALISTAFLKVPPILISILPGPARTGKPCFFNNAASDLVFAAIAGPLTGSFISISWMPLTNNGSCAFWGKLPNTLPRSAFVNFNTVSTPFAGKRSVALGNLPRNLERVNCVLLRS